MKLTAFRIKNYRSIIDTGWTRLAPDNITTLIGQNESGKTSILEALNSFYNSFIDEDILRSDLSLPMVSCEFSLSQTEIKALSSTPELPSRIIGKIITCGKLHLNRKWTGKNDSILYYGDEQMLKAYQEEELADKNRDRELNEESERILTENEDLNERINAEVKEKNTFLQDLSMQSVRREKLEKLIQKTRNDRKIESAQRELSEIQANENRLQVKISQIENSCRINKERLEAISDLAAYAVKLRLSHNMLLANREKISELRHEHSSVQENLQLSTEGKNKMQLRTELLRLEEELQKELNSAIDLEVSRHFARECFYLSLQDNSENEIESQAWDRVNEKTAGAGIEKAGEILFSHIPDFKLFEDFSSLLPNKIDLDDILNLKQNVEGYNAARNFLIVSGLDAEFFKESNNRILKQKIENLNGEITLHFQGYWRQNLGKKNKIKLNFELEHYDISHPEKKGKPYLEFWIKDDHERLYPKQRSRGVRWFLSFYLELKATSLEKNRRGKVLLIDEPGLSLHARAQEDVLKVFEDLKENVQIVYSTHSPHLINTEKLYRLLAVQRANEFDDRSETRVFDISSLSEVTGDTLSPVYTLLGTKISESNFIREKNNIILEDNISYYYINTLYSIFEKEKELHFLPSTSVENVPLLLNLLMGWKLNFGVLLSENHHSSDIISEIREKNYFCNEEELQANVKVVKGIQGIEDIFSTIDFKKYVLRKRTGITESNLEYIEKNNLNRNDLATSFALYCQNQKLSPEDLDEESRGNIRLMISQILSMVK